MKKLKLYVVSGLIGIVILVFFLKFMADNQIIKGKKYSLTGQSTNVLKPEVFEQTTSGTREIVLVVNGMSMYPTLKHGENVRGILFSGEKNINRYDIVIVKFKTLRKPVLKRVIGLPGDVVSFSGGALFINGDPEDARFVYPSGYRYGLNDSQLLQMQIKRLGGRIPPDMYLLMGDNRSDSKDSRKFGLVDKKQIIGKVIGY